QLEDQIFRCLQKASERKANTIAFPTIGCGSLCYNPLDVVRCIDQASRRHGSDYSCHLSKVSTWFFYTSLVIICAYDGQLHQEFEHLVGLIGHSTTEMDEDDNLEDDDEM
ncbi:hypothetical protein NP493_122g07037, partial [Ridgeia piscesae]